MTNAAKHFKFPNKYSNWFNTNHYFVLCLFTIYLFFFFFGFRFSLPVYPVHRSFFLFSFCFWSLADNFLGKKKCVLILFFFRFSQTHKIFICMSWTFDGHFPRLIRKEKTGEQQKLIQHNNSCYKIVCCYFRPISFQQCIAFIIRRLTKIPFVLLSTMVYIFFRFKVKPGYEDRADCILLYFSKEKEKKQTNMHMPPKMLKLF